VIISGDLAERILAPPAAGTSPVVTVSGADYRVAEYVAAHPLPEPVEPSPLAGERTLLRHTETGLTVSEDLDAGGVWIRQETPGTVDEVYVTRGAWMVMCEWLGEGVGDDHR